MDSWALGAFVQELDPRYILPCRQTLSGKMIPDNNIIMIITMTMFMVLSS